MSTEPPEFSDLGLPPEYVAPPAPPPPREPAWTGVELTAIVMLTVGAILAFSVVALLGWALLAQAAGWRAVGVTEFRVVVVTLLGQTAGMATGFFFAQQWISGVRGRKFAQAIHWNRRTLRASLGLLAGGAVLMVVVQLLGSVLPMPKNVPIDQLFTPRTAWLLLIYGIGIAPFFEEFFFRGLLYPSLKATFQEGMTPDELRGWQPVTRLLAGMAVLAALYWRLRMHVLGQVHPVTSALLAGVVLLGAFVVAMPQPLLRAVAWVINSMAGWRCADLLAIVFTGTLFGLLHASQLGWAWAAVLILVFVGIVLTVVRARTGSLMASWLFHCAYNGTLFVAQLITTRGFQHFT